MNHIDDGHYYDVTITHTDAAAPYTPLGRTTAHVRVSERPGDEVMCAALLAFTDLTQQMSFAVEPARGASAGHGASSSPHQRLRDVIDRLGPHDLRRGWLTGVRHGENMLTSYALPDAAARAGASTSTLTWESDDDHENFAQTWCFTLHHPAEGTTARLAVTATGYTESITAFLVAFSAAFPRSDTRRAALQSRADHDELLRFLLTDLDDTDALAGVTGLGHVLAAGGPIGLGHLGGHHVGFSAATAGAPTSTTSHYGQVTR